MTGNYNDTNLDGTHLNEADQDGLISQMGSNLATGQLASNNTPYHHPAMSAMSPTSPSTAQPTPEQIDTLRLASAFAYQIWQDKPTAVKAFLRSYPLATPLSEQQIKDLIRDYTLDDECQVADEASVMRGLRHLRNFLQLRWIWQDALQLIGLEQLTWELTKFADECLIFAKDYVYHTLVKRYGRPIFYAGKHKPQVDDLAIIAMGKMGAQELNLSSDIDLIFVHQGQGDTDGDRDQGTKSIDTKKFFTKW